MSTEPAPKHDGKLDDLIVGKIVHFVDETAGDYNHHAHLPALVQHVYQTGGQGYAHLHVYEAYPEDNRAVDALYSEGEEPGTWHWAKE